MGDFWVFGYGSLMWNPGFEVQEQRQARMYGLHRALCVYSWVHRGTQTRPGLVLGLDHGGCCDGIAFRVAASNRDAVIDYLRARELVTNVYLESWRQVRLADGTRPMALTYRADRAHPQYARGLSIEEQAELVRAGQGKSGLNTDYLINTVEHLREMRIHDGTLESIYQQLF